MNQKIKIAIAIVVILGFGFNCIKNSKIESVIEDKIEEANKKEGLSLLYDEVDCSGFASVDCEIKKVKFITEKKVKSFKKDEPPKIQKSEVQLSKVKFYSVENYKDLKEGVENRDINIKMDLIGFKLDRKDFLQGVEEKPVIELLKNIHEAANYFNIHSEFVVNVKSKKDSILNKLDVKKFKIDAGEASLSGKMLIKDLSLDKQNSQNMILDRFNLVFKENNLKGIFVNWLSTIEKKYPQDYATLCENAYVDPKTTSPLRLYAKLRDEFINKELNNEIKNAKYKHQKDLYNAIKIVLEEKSNQIDFDFTNKTQITLGKLFTGIMMKALTKKDPNQFILDNVELNIAPK